MRRFDLPGHRQPDERPARRGVRDVERVAAAEHLLQAGARIAEAHTVLDVAGGDSGAVIFDFDDRAISLASGAHRDPAGTDVRGEPVRDRVLDERLENEDWYQRPPHVGRRLDGHVEPRAEPGPLDLDVALEQLDLPRQRHEIHAAGVERFAQQMTEPRDHAIGRRRVLVHELRHRIQRVEQEVRVELHLEQLQPCLRQTCLGARRAQLPFRLRRRSTPQRARS